MSKHRSTKTNLFTALILPIAFVVLFTIYLQLSLFQILSDSKWILVALIFLGTTALIVTIIAKIIRSGYIKLITHQSPTLQSLENINSQYKFEQIHISYLSQDYDNEFFYNNISPVDYLTYQLVYMKKQVCDDIDATCKNSLIYPTYCEEVESLRNQLDNYLPENIIFKTAFQKIHRQIFDDGIQCPVTEFSITVKLYLTKINGAYVTSKEETFYASKIKDIIQRLRNKQNDFYLDYEVWQSICRVERGKITNKIRFAIYARDGHRCRNCGSDYDLEIDHIFPISKGGKSTYDNLQTLCHRCNALKSDSVTAESINHYTQTHSNAQSICPQCKRGILVVRNGKNGKFYGCNNYPNCKFTKSL